MNKLSQSEIEFITQCLKRIQKGDKLTKSVLPEISRIYLPRKLHSSPFRSTAEKTVWLVN